MKLSNYNKGLLAEFIAKIFMQLKFYSVLSQRENRLLKKRGIGEIDLIFKRGRNLVFCEVKYRKTIDDAIYSIIPRQQKRLRRGAEQFLKGHPKFYNYEIRFDVIAIAPYKIKHLKNVRI